MNFEFLNNWESTDIIFTGKVTCASLDENVYLKSEIIQKMIKDIGEEKDLLKSLRNEFFYKNFVDWILLDESEERKELWNNNKK